MNFRNKHYNKLSVSAGGAFRALLERAADPGESISATARRLILAGVTANPTAPRGFRWTRTIAVFELDAAAGEIRLKQSGDNWTTIPFLGDCT